MLADETVFAPPSDLHGSEPVSIRKGEIDGGFEVFLGVMLMLQDERHRIH